MTPPVICKTASSVACLDEGANLVIVAPQTTLTPGDTFQLLCEIGELRSDPLVVTYVPEPSASALLVAGLLTLPLLRKIKRCHKS